ncbi:MAG: hypothetical protein KY469_02025 [Actinobacteria bacterium]|nr:hypothetical protein [Actinomycetota bacterium]
MGSHSSAVRATRAALAAALLALLLALGSGVATAQELDECYPLPPEECVEVQGEQFNRNPAPVPAAEPAIAPLDVERTHPVTGFDLDTAILVAIAAALAAGGLLTASRRVEARQRSTDS